MTDKKKIVFHSNHSKAFTGFGKNCKNVLSYLQKTGKYEIVEFCNGLPWSHPDLKKLPWKAFGSLPDDQSILDKASKDPQLGRSAGYGSLMVDKIIEQEKPDLYIGAEDIWAFNSYTEKDWWNKTNCMIWTTLDSLPILPDAINKAKKIKNYFVWASFAEKALNDAGHTHVKTLHGSIDCSNFYRLTNDQRFRLRNFHGINQSDFIIGFVFRNQLRKTVPNLLEGFKMFLNQEPSSNAKLLLHTHWSEGWDIPRFLQEKGIDPKLVLTTYFCHSCSSYEIKSFAGQDQTCRFCNQKTSNTTNTKHGVNESQLNEVYNLMDLYCHPFSSGGQEIPIQEAKLTELITLVTNYSCGTDSCSPESGGIPLDWSEYREPGTQFIKASTSSFSISKNIKKVFNMKREKIAEIGKKSRKYVLENYDSSVIGKKLENIIDSLPEVNYDFNLKFKARNPDYNPPNIDSDSKWIIDLYKNILIRDVNEMDSGHQHWMQRLKSDMNRSSVLEYFQSVARKENQENIKIDFSEVFEKNGRKKCLMVSASDLNILFAATSLLDSFHDIYPDTDLYFACHPQFMYLLFSNPNIKKVLAYQENMENELAMIGTPNQKGYVDYYINLNNCHLKNISAKNSYEFH